MTLSRTFRPCEIVVYAFAGGKCWWGGGNQVIPGCLGLKLLFLIAFICFISLPASSSIMHACPSSHLSLALALSLFLSLSLRFSRHPAILLCSILRLWWPFCCLSEMHKNQIIFLFFIRPPPISTLAAHFLFYFFYIFLKYKYTLCAVLKTKRWQDGQGGRGAGGRFPGDCIRNVESNFLDYSW